MPNLLQVTLPEGLTTVGARVFFGCMRLADVVFPSGVTTIESSAFSRCARLTDFRVAPGSVHLSVIDSVLFDRAGRTLLAYPAGREDEAYAVPACTERIGDGAFREYAHRKTVTLPAGVKAIGRRAFGGCAALAHVDLPKGLKAVPGAAFSRCRALRTVMFPAGLTVIEKNAFEQCEALTDIALPKGLEAIGKEAFRDCWAPERLRLPAGLREIGEGAFDGCPDPVMIVPKGSYAADTPGKTIWRWSTQKKRFQSPQTIGSIEKLLRLSTEEFLMFRAAKRRRYLLRVICRSACASR